jgi:hypothetical protein
MQPQSRNQKFWEGGGQRKRRQRKTEQGGQQRFLHCRAPAQGGCLWWIVCSKMKSGKSARGQRCQGSSAAGPRRSFCLCCLGKSAAQKTTAEGTNPAPFPFLRAPALARRGKRKGVGWGGIFSEQKPKKRQRGIGKWRRTHTHARMYIGAENTC